MKPWAEMTGATRAGVVGAVAAVIAALLYGAWSVRGPAPAPVAENAASGEAAAPEGEAAAGTEAEEPVAEAAAATEAAPAEEAVTEEAVTEEAGAAEEPVAAEPAPAEEAAAEAAPAEEAAAGAAATEEAAPAEEGAAAEPVAEAAAPAVAAPVPPSFDLVRVEKDGSALVAGKAEAASMLSLRVTGSEIAAVPADGQGNFVAMFNLAPSNAPRVLSLVMKLADGTEVPAEGSVVIAPTVAPEVVVAAAEPAATEASAAEAAGTEGAAATETAASEAAAVEAAPVAEAAPAALLVTDEGAKVLQSADALPAELVANVTIDTITYTPEGAVQLAGRGTAERAVRIYLDNAQVGGDVSISTSGDWAVTLPEVAPGIYTLRADQVDEAGKVTSRFETPFKRETVEALAAASGAAEEPVAEAAAAPADDAAATEVAAAETTEATEGAATEAAAAETAGPLTVTVQPGFTLWRIATENLGEGIRYVQVFEANKDQIRDPDLIYPGQVFTIPKGE